MKKLPFKNILENVLERSWPPSIYKCEAYNSIITHIAVELYTVPCVRDELAEQKLNL